MIRICLLAIGALTAAAVAAPASAAPQQGGFVAAPAGLPGMAALAPPSAGELQANGKGTASTVLRLVTTSVKAYARVGWELGRLTAPQDPGPFPGVVQAVAPAIKQAVKKGR